MVHSNLRQVHSTGWARTGLLAALGLLLQLGACNDHSAADQYEQQFRACSVAEGNGLLDSAVLTCGTALRIAEEQAYAPEQRSSLLLKLGQLERQRGNFEEAEKLLRRSLAIEESAGESGAPASRLIELALILAGEDRWLDGAELLERAIPLLDSLGGRDRSAAANVFRGYSLRLQMRGQPEHAARFMGVAQELNGA